MSDVDRDLGKARCAPGRKAVDILLSVPAELKERMVNVITWTQPYTGISTQQAFIRRAVVMLCDQLERELNAGEPFEPRATLQ